MEFSGNASNDALVAAIAELKEKKNPAIMKDIYENMVSGKFYIPATLDPKPVKDAQGKIIGKPAEQVKVNFRIIHTEDKKSFLPCFTDRKTYDETANAADAEAIVVTYPELAQMVVKSNGNIHGFVINPFSNSLQINADMVKQIEDAKEKMIAEKNSPVKKQQIEGKIKVRAPKYMPFALIDEAKKYFDENGTVNAAYIQMLEQKGKEDEYLVAVDMDGDPQKVFAELFPLIKDLSYGIKVALTTTDEGLGQSIAAHTEPFYKKGE